MTKKKCCSKEIKDLKEWIKNNPKKAHGFAIGLGIGTAGYVGYKIGKR